MKLVITGAWKYSQAQLDAIKQLGHEVYDMQDERGVLPCDYEDVEGVICNGLFLHHPIEKFSALKYIQLTSAGFDRVPMAYIRANGIEVHNAAGVYSIPMAEFAVASVLQFYKQSAFFYENQKRRAWEKNRNLLELSGKNVCIVGCGSVGKACAQRFRAFGCYVIGVNRTAIPCDDFDAIYPLSCLHEALRSADVVVLSIALTPETRHLMDKAALSVMKIGAVLVNIARGGIVDTEPLTEALKSRKLYAALDVYDTEPLPPESPLWDLDNAILTPHNSFVGEHNADRLWNVIKKHLSAAEERG